MLAHSADDPGSFVYERDGGGGGWKAAKYKPTADIYFLEGLLSLLDAETEWHYERSTREVHLKTRGDADPTSMAVAARVEEYAIAATGVSHLNVHGLGFFATTIYIGGETNAVDVQNVRLDSCRFTHPSAQKRMLGECRYSWPTTLARKKGVQPPSRSGEACVACSRLLALTSHTRPSFTPRERE